MLHKVKQKQMKTSHERWVRETRRSSHKPGAKKKTPGAQAELLSELKSHAKAGSETHTLQRQQGSLQGFPLWDRRGGDEEGASWPPVPWLSEGRTLSYSVFKAFGDS